MSSLSVRLATPADLKPLVALYVSFRDSLQRATPTAEEFEGRLLRLLALPEVRIFLAEAGDIAVGYTFLRHFDSAWASGKECLVEDLFVAEAHRGKRIAQTLIVAGLADAKSRGCTSASLDTNEKNEASNAVYRKLGFTCARARWAGGRQIRYDIKLV
jgi:GNAT superfamily N-acetyltransferase